MNPNQTSLIAGTLFQSTHLPLTVWFLAIYLISQAKTGLSSVALMRHLGVSYPTARLIQRKLKETTSKREPIITPLPHHGRKPDTDQLKLT